MKILSNKNYKDLLSSVESLKRDNDYLYGLIDNYEKCIKELIGENSSLAKQLLETKSKLTRAYARLGGFIKASNERKKVTK